MTRAADDFEAIREARERLYEPLIDYDGTPLAHCDCPKLSNGLRGGWNNACPVHGLNGTHNREQLLRERCEG